MEKPIKLPKQTNKTPIKPTKINQKPNKQKRGEKSSNYYLMEELFKMNEILQT